MTTSTKKSRRAIICAASVCKNRKNQKEAARVFRQMMRGGFGAKTIFAILKKWDVDDETLQVAGRRTGIFKLESGGTGRVATRLRLPLKCWILPRPFR